MPGTTQAQEFTTAGADTFNVGATVNLVWVTMIAGGAGAPGNISSQNSTGCSGAGSGEYCMRVPYPVTPGGTVSLTVGAKGVGVSATVGTAGGDTIFGTLKVRGAPACAANTTPGAGGGVGGGSGVTPITGIIEGGGFFGGSNGGTVAGAAGGAPGFPGGAGRPSSGGLGGGGGASSPWGQGPTGANTNVGNGVNASATAYGAGGSGGSNANGSNRTGGDGADGYILVQWVA